MKKSVLILGMFLGLMFTAQAQTATPNVNQKQQNQKVRITNGVIDGELNRRETRILVKDQKELQRMENRAKADGKVTKKERAILNAKAHQNSKKIYRKKNN